MDTIKKGQFAAIYSQADIKDIVETTYHGDEPPATEPRAAQTEGDNNPDGFDRARSQMAHYEDKYNDLSPRTLKWC